MSTTIDARAARAGSKTASSSPVSSQSKSEMIFQNPSSFMWRRWVCFLWPNVKVQRFAGGSQGGICGSREQGSAPTAPVLPRLVQEVQSNQRLPKPCGIQEVSGWQQPLLLGIVFWWHATRVDLATTAEAENSGNCTAPNQTADKYQEVLDDGRGTSGDQADHWLRKNGQNLLSSVLRAFKAKPED